MNSYKKYDHLNIANTKRGHRSISPSDKGFLSLLLFWILPFLVINGIIFVLLTSQPKFEVMVEDPGDYKTALVTVKVKSVFPNNGIHATLAGEPFELKDEGKKTYTGVANTNGTLQVELENKNGMNKIVYETISCIDDAPPTITQGDTEPGFVSLYIDDAQSGVNFGSVYALDADGNHILPSLVDEGEALVVFDFDSPSLEVHASDNIGQETVATFSTVSAAAEGADVNAENADGAATEGTAESAEAAQ